MYMDKIRQDIDNIRQNYYQENSKNRFFKKSQKDDIAKQVCDNIDFDTLIRNTITIEDNNITLSYPVLKLYCHEGNYEAIVDNIILAFQTVTSNYGSFNCIVNLESFTISAAERHKDFVKMFCDKCLKDSSTNYSNSLNVLKVINPPNIMDTLYKIFNPFIDGAVKNKICIQK